MFVQIASKELIKVHFIQFGPVNKNNGHKIMGSVVCLPAGRQVDAALLLKSLLTFGTTHTSKYGS